MNILKSLKLVFIVFSLFSICFTALNVQAQNYNFGGFRFDYNLKNVDTIFNSNQTPKDKRDGLIAEYMVSNSQLERHQISNKIQELNKKIGDVKDYDQSQKAIYAPEVLQNSKTASGFMEFMTSGTGLTIISPKGGSTDNIYECKDFIQFGQLKIPSFCAVEKLPNYYPFVILVAFMFLIKGAITILQKYKPDSPLYVSHLRKMGVGMLVFIVVISGALVSLITFSAGVTNQFTKLGLMTFQSRTATDCKANIQLNVPNQTQQPNQEVQAPKNSSVCAFWRKTGDKCLTQYGMTCAIEESAYNELADGIIKTKIASVKATVFEISLPLSGTQKIPCDVCDLGIKTYYFWSAYFQNLPLMFYIFIMMATLPLVILVMLLLEFIKFLFKVYLLPIRAGADLDGGNRVADDMADIFQYFTKVASLSIILSLFFYLMQYIFVTTGQIFAVIYVFVISGILLSFASMFDDRVSETIDNAKGNFRAFVDPNTRELASKTKKTHRRESIKEDRRKDRIERDRKQQVSKEQKDNEKKHREMSKFQRTNDQNHAKSNLKSDNHKHGNKQNNPEYSKRDQRVTNRKRENYGDKNNKTNPQTT
jgi:hypothetical protein